MNMDLLFTSDIHTETNGNYSLDKIYVRWFMSNLISHGQIIMNYFSLDIVSLGDAE